MLIIGIAVIAIQIANYKSLKFMIYTIYFTFLVSYI